MRNTLLLIALGVAGCQTCHTSNFGGRPGCPSCGPSPGASRFVPAPPPVTQTPRPPVMAEGQPPEPPRAPETAERPKVEVGPPRVKAESKPVPEAAPKADASIPKPDDETPPAIDLPGFTAALPGVTSGLQPFPDGQDWLARKGYKTVLHLRGALDDTSAAKRQFEKKGINYVSIQVSPATLTRESADEFIRVVTDAKGHPLFVYDKEGSAAGAMWFLYYKLHLKADDDKARAEAARLGFRADDEEHKTMWVAVQALLKKAAGE
ncbi:MAG: fused DSP-PTPase phosphatase/NAD kinase-like protein [Gemmataceae bacterium]